MPLVLDASVAIAASLNDERSDHRDYAARALRRLAEDSGHVPALWRTEVANTLLVAERRRRLASRDALAILGDWLVMDIEHDAPPTGAILVSTLALARRHGLTVYDAAYVELALRRGAALASLDGAMIRAAAVEGVPIFA